MSLSLFKTVDGNLVQKIAADEEEEQFWRDAGYFPLGEGPWKDPSVPEKRGPGRPKKVE